MVSSFSSGHAPAGQGLLITWGPLGPWWQWGGWPESSPFLLEVEVRKSSFRSLPGLLRCAGWSQFRSSAMAICPQPLPVPGQLPPPPTSTAGSFWTPPRPTPLGLGARLLLGLFTDRSPSLSHLHVAPHGEWSLLLLCGLILGSNWEAGPIALGVCLTLKVCGEQQWGRGGGGCGP